VAKHPPPLPGFLCRAAEELATEEWRELTLAERGLLHSLRLLCWSNGSAPGAPDAIARHIGVEKAEVRRAFTPAVKNMFAVEDDRLVSPELEQERVRAAHHKRKLSEAGTRGAAAKYGSYASDQASGVGSGQASGLPIAGRKEGMEEKKANAEATPAHNNVAAGYIEKINGILANSKRMPT
jgi:hypothetical protein